MAQRVESRVVVEPELPAISVDANRMQQVFVNLVNNASQAIASTGRPGTVTMRARRFLDEITVAVIDDGPGMTEEVAAQVFEPFFTTKPEHEGTGLGHLHQPGHREGARGAHHARHRAGPRRDLHRAPAHRARELDAPVRRSRRARLTGRSACW